MPDFTDKITLTPPGSNTPVFAIDLNGNTYIKGALATPTSQELFEDGTVSAPSIAFVNNPNRGIYNDTTNAGIGFTIAGTEVAYINASSVAIAQNLLPTTDAAVALGTSSLRFTIGNFSGTVRVGVLTNNTGTFYGGSNAQSTAYLDTAVTSAVGSSVYGRKARGTQAALTDAASGDAMLNLIGQPLSTSYFDTAQIKFVVDGTFTTAQRPPSRIEFYTNAANGAQTLQVNIDNGGAVRCTTSVFVGGDLGTGTASTFALTNATNTTLTNAYIVKGGQAANTINTGWIKVYVGTAVTWIPYWTNATP